MEDSFLVYIREDKIMFFGRKHQKRQMRMLNNAFKKNNATKGESLIQFSKFFDIVKNNDDSVEIFSKNFLPPL